MTVIFILGYSAIALEHPIKVDKAASALITGVLLWAIYVLNSHTVLDLNFSPTWAVAQDVAQQAKDLIQPTMSNIEFDRFGWGEKLALVHDQHHFVKHELEHHLVEIAEILFFLLGAMTIVEVVDRSGGFKIITDRIKTLNKVKLLWIFSILTFFMSAALDNLTTTIVMLALIRKIMANQKDKWFFASMVVLASNAGGAWSPIGDVTTIMLWIGEQITAQRIIIDTIFPSFVTMVVPVIIMSFVLKGEVEPAVEVNDDEDGIEKFKAWERNTLLIIGVASLLFVPVFKSITHLPPYLGMLLGLGNIWLATEIMHRNKSAKFRKKYNVIGILKHVDVATIFFFMGILTAVAALQSAGHLDLLAGTLDSSLGNIYLIDLSIGVLSAIVDNVPLVAGSMGMYPVYTQEMIDALAATDPAAAEYYKEFMVDGNFWKFLAYCAGTGGSILIIGSAAGVAAMGIEKIDFIWYFKKISLLAFIGYISGAFVYWLMFA
jgi:Na+/H+ antiporter NhaD/arsenite permease-like protein